MGWGKPRSMHVLFLNLFFRFNGALNTDLLFLLRHAVSGPCTVKVEMADSAKTQAQGSWIGVGLAATQYVWLLFLSFFLSFFLFWSLRDLDFIDLHCQCLGWLWRARLLRIS